MSNAITEFSIKELLSDNVDYIVPMYQRNYAWEEGEITQLIQDILDYQQQEHQRYYIGTLVVFGRNDGSYEVIDGQQRFTTLSLLAICLKNLGYSKKPAQGEFSSKYPDMDWYENVNIGFESRPKSTDTFRALIQGVSIHHLNNDAYNERIVNGYELLAKAVSQINEASLKLFTDYLFDSVKIIRVEVPADTNLNHYFEVMNNRGEQLEKHEVLKAKMMAVLNKIEDEDDRHLSVQVLQRIWEACANMERYIQYGFSSNERHKLFGKDWGRFEAEDFNHVVKCLREGSASSNSYNLLQILSGRRLKTGEDQESRNEESPDRFNSVINFSNFLLHVLRVYTAKDITLDDKQLINQFEEYLLNKIDPVAEVKEFTFALLKSKFLFDQYIIKREYTQGSDAWSLKRLKWYSAKSASFINSFDDNEDGYEGVNRQILMLLSALHVSTPTLVYKHWLNAALYFLYYEKTITPQNYLNYLSNLAKRFIFDRFLSPDEGCSYYEMIYQQNNDYFPRNRKLNNLDMDRLYYGKIENNFIFNYLDYLLWLERKDQDPVVQEFEFTFRSSVEHFYPQHPMEGHPVLESDALHEFGNLCLISHSKNSRLSNLPPDAKRSHFEAGIREKSVDSLKLYEMIKLLKDNGDWSEKEIDKHGHDMLELLLASTAV